MRIRIDVGEDGGVQREMHLRLEATEVALAELHIAHAAERNRSSYYLRRHGATRDAAGVDQPVDPNTPVRAAQEPPKLTIPQHLESLWRSGRIAWVEPPAEKDDRPFHLEPTTIVVPISDLVANLLRPAFHRGFETRRIFHLEGEPIDRQSYMCLCFTESGAETGLEIRALRFDPSNDCVVDLSGRSLTEVVWAAGLVPLVGAGNALQPVEIARRDYDLRQLLGRDDTASMQHVYAGWYESWDERVEMAVNEHILHGREFASFYHSAIGIDAEGGIHILQTEATLPDLAQELARLGMVNAGLLDSGGSCALYDARLGSYLNHGWYFREPRGAVVAIQLNHRERVPAMSGYWFQKRRGAIDRFKSG